MLETKKAKLFDIVELVEDLPEYGVKRGEQGVVVEILDDPEEAYILEFVDESGTSSRLAYWVKPDQIKSSDEIAKEALEHGITLHNEGKGAEAEEEFRQAIELKPSLIEDLHNRIVNGFENSGTLENFIFAMRLILRLDPSYEVARRNLAIAYENQGVQEAERGNLYAASNKLQMALAIGASEEILSCIRKNLAAVYTLLGLKAIDEGDVHSLIGFMGMACAIDTNERTRENYGLAYAHLGWLYLKDQEYQNAITAFECAKEMGLSTYDLINNYGIALAGSGYFNTAIWAFEKILEMAPDDEIAQRNLHLVRKAKEERKPSINLDNEMRSMEFPIAPPMQLEKFHSEGIVA